MYLSKAKSNNFNQWLKWGCNLVVVISSDIQGLMLTPFACLALLDRSGLFWFFTAEPVGVEGVVGVRSTTIGAKRPINYQLVYSLATGRIIYTRSLLLLLTAFADLASLDYICYNFCWTSALLIHHLSLTNHHVPIPTFDKVSMSTGRVTQRNHLLLDF